MTKVPNMMMDRPPEDDEDRCAKCGHIERQHWYGESPTHGYAVPCNGVTFHPAYVDGQRGTTASRCHCPKFVIPEKRQKRLV